MAITAEQFAQYQATLASLAEVPARITPESSFTQANATKSENIYYFYKYNQRLWNVIDGATGYLRKTDAPTVVSDLTNDAGYQTASDVTTAINNALSGISTISLSVVSSLPSSGATGVIYLIANNSGQSQNIYDEYIWNATTSTYEKLGTTDVDLSGYVQINSLKSKGSATQPIFFDANGAAQSTTYALNKTVPADAVFTDTTYTAGTGIEIKDGVISSTAGSIDVGVTSVAEGSTNGAVSVTTNGATTSVPVHGLGTAAFADTTDFTSSSAGVTDVSEGTTDGTVSVTIDGTATDVSVHGLGSAAYADTTDFLASNTNLGVSAVAEGSVNGEISVTTNGTTAQVAVHGLGSAAFADVSDFMSGSASTGVSAVAEGSGNGQIAVTTNGTTSQVSVHGLGTAAYTASTDYLASNTTYAGSSTAGGSATSAVKLDDSNVGSATKGVYIDANGKPAAMTYAVAKDVPSDASFTDTTYTNGTGISIDTSDNNKIALTSAAQASLALADTAVQPEDIVLVTDAQIEAMFASSGS